MKRSPKPQSPKPAHVSTSMGQALPLGWIFALFFTLCFAAYWPAIRGELLWDDAGHVTAPALQSWSGLARIWLEPGATQQYYPLLHTAFWIESRLWGNTTFGYHLINVIWHAAAACLFVALLRRLAVPGALLAGLLFAMHPVAVESVAWISEQKNTLSLVFYLAAALAWLRYEEDRRPSRYAVAALWFLAALLTKTVTATLPAALLVIAWWRHGRIDWRKDVAPILPLLILGVATGLATAWLETHHIGASGADFALGPIERLLLAGRVVFFYLGKLVWPVGLAFFYPRWEVDAGVWWQWLFPLGVFAALALAIWWSRRNRAPLAAALLFGGTLFPVLGFVNVYPFVFSYVADHFQYHASIGMIAFFSASATLGWSRLEGQRRWAPAAVAGLVALLAVLTWHQSRAYGDAIGLYQKTLQRNPSSWVAHLNLGVALDDAGRPQDALPHLQRANELKPDFPETLNSLGNCLHHLGRSNEAIPLLERALEIDPRFALAHNTQGVVLMAIGRDDAGISAFTRALEMSPDLTQARLNLAWAFASSGQLAEAIDHFEQAIRELPDEAEPEFKFGLAYAMQNHMTEALPHLQRAVELQPNDPEIRQALGQTLLELGRPADAARQFNVVLSMYPNHALAHLQLAFALSSLGVMAEANEHYQIAIQLNPSLAQ